MGKIERGESENVAIGWEKVRHLQYLHSVAEKYKDSIFSRAGLLLATTAVQIGFLCSMASGSTQLLQPTSAGYVKVLWLVALAWQLVCGGIALSAIMPLRNLTAVRDIVYKHRPEMSSSSPALPLLSSFNHVILKERETICRELIAADAKRLFDDLSITYYNLCHIVNARYVNLRLAYASQLVGFGLSITSALTAVFGA